MGTLFIIAAPSGAGKTSLVAALLASTPNLVVSISHTTRSPRPNEVHGRNYYFIDENTFLTMRNDHDFLESASVFGHYYGTSKKWVEAQLQSGNDVILEIDWQGAAIVRGLFPDCVSIFIIPPSRQQLEARLRQRAQDDDAVIARRMQAAKNECSHYQEFDYLVMNEDFERARQDLQYIVLSQRLRMKAQVQQCAEQLADLLA